MKLDALEFASASSMEKIVLAKRVGQFLGCEIPPEQRNTAEDIARTLARDVSDQVRAALAYEVRDCNLLPTDLAEQIATDVEYVATPFLETTTVFSDAQLADLVPRLRDPAQVTLARRTDLGERTVHAIAQKGSQAAVSELVANTNVPLSEQACQPVVDRFGACRDIMDGLGARLDLPIAVVHQIIGLVSDKCRCTLTGHYAVPAPVAARLAEAAKVRAFWRRIEHASPGQVHGFVLDLKAQGELSHQLALRMAEKGSRAFMESALAVAAGLPLCAVREALSLQDTRPFVALMRVAGVGKFEAPRYLKLAKATARPPVPVGPARGTSLGAPA